jgi:hypothetical protein
MGSPPLGIVEGLSLNQGDEALGFDEAQALREQLHAFLAYFGIGNHGITSLIKPMGSVMASS